MNIYDVTIGDWIFREKASSFSVAISRAVRSAKKKMKIDGPTINSCSVRAVVHSRDINPNDPIPELKEGDS